MYEEQMAPELISKYGKQIVIPFDLRRRNYEAYLNELVNPSAEQRKALQADLLDTLYSIQPWVMFYLEKDLPQQFGLAPGTEAKADLGEFLKAKLAKFGKYYAASQELFERLKAVYLECNTEDKAKSVIKSVLGQSDAPAELIATLEEEYLKVWKADHLMLLYFGDLAERFDGFQPVHMSEFLRFTNTPREKAMSTLLTQYASKASTRGMPFVALLLTLDLEWSIQDLLKSVGNDKDEIEAGGIRVNLVRDRSHKLEDFAKDSSVPENVRKKIEEGLKDGKITNSNLVITQSIILYKDGKELASLTPNGQIVAINGVKNESGVQITDIILIVSLLNDAIAQLGISAQGKSQGVPERSISQAPPTETTKNPEPAAAADTPKAKGIAYFRQGRFAEAVESLKKALEQNGDDAEAFYELGNAYYSLGRLDDAIACYRKTLVLDPGNKYAKDYLKLASSSK